MELPDCCLRNRIDCWPLANIRSDGEPISFICVGRNDPETRVEQTDVYTLCWKNDAVDERGHWDRRDLIDTISVIAQALSVEENMNV